MRAAPPCASLRHITHRRLAGERRDEERTEVGPMIDIVIAATTIAAMALIGFALERSERAR